MVFGGGENKAFIRMHSEREREKIKKWKLFFLASSFSTFRIDEALAKFWWAPELGVGLGVAFVGGACKGCGNCFRPNRRDFWVSDGL